ncbi:MAG: hypothetical protein J5517_07430 [Eubacterium sp.]|nr:hypothetical protein [Eubacterium sp.]
MLDFEKVKDDIALRLMNTENNQEKLQERPNVQMEDMSASLVIVVGETKEGLATAPITNEIMAELGTDKDTLMETAKANMAEQDYSFKSMRDVLIGTMFPDGVPENDPMVEMMLPPEDGPQMYVLSNENNLHGAAEIMNQKAMDEIADKLGGDFVVLPSSVHEVIVLPYDDSMDSATLDNMIQEINGGVVSPEDKLSDHAFMYDSEAHELVRMDKMEERKQEKEASIENTDKSQDDRSEKKVEAKTAEKAEKQQKSLTDRISNKKEKIAQQEATRPHPSKDKKVALG